MNSTIYNFAIARKLMIEQNEKNCEIIIDNLINDLKKTIYLYTISKVYGIEKAQRYAANRLGLLKRNILVYKKILLILQLDKDNTQFILNNQYDEKQFDAYLKRASKREKNINKILEGLQ